MKANVGAAKQLQGSDFDARRSLPHAAGDLGLGFVLALGLLILPWAPLAQRIGVVLIATAVGVINAGCERRVPVALRSPILAGINCVGSIAAAAVAPVLWHAAIILLVGSLFCATITESRRISTALAACSVVGIGLVGLIHRNSLPDLWYVSLFITFALLACIEVWFRDWDGARSERIRHHDELLDRARTFSWEVDSSTFEIMSLAGNVEGVLGYSPEELVGEPGSRFISMGGLDLVYRRTWLVGDEQHAILTTQHKDGSEIVLHEVRLDSSDQHLVRGVTTDVTEAERTTKAMQHQARHDSLTGLLNRSAFSRVVESALADDANGCGALLLVDLDRFKEVNDTLGHATGDQLLEVLAERFSVPMDHVGAVARIGGDEFAFCIDGTKNVEEILGIADTISQLASSPAEIDGFRLSTSASIGIALTSKHGDTYDELLKNADIASYEAKRSGGGTKVFKTAPNEMSRKRLRLVTEMPAALSDGQFELFLQPQVALEDGSIVGAEGLARWHHPELGVLSPASFLHTIEVAADYHRFTNEIVRQAISFVTAASSLGRDLAVSVNLGSMSLRDEGLPERVALMLKSMGVAGTSLTFEIVESDLIQDDPIHLAVIAGLKKLGIRVSLDDFGTGHSNFSQLKTLAADEIKIDQSFVTGLDTSNEDRAIVKSLIGLAHELGYTVIAEGVETEAQAEILRGHGCHFAQGYFYGRPLTQSSFLAILAKGTGHLGPPDRANVVLDGKAEPFVLSIADGSDLLNRRDEVTIRSAIDALYDSLEANEGPTTAIAVRDNEGRLVDGNSAFTAFLGQDNFDQVIGSRDEDFADENDSQHFTLDDMVVDELSTTFGAMTAAIRARDKHRVYAITATPLYDQTNQIIGRVQISNPKQSSADLSDVTPASTS